MWLRFLRKNLREKADRRVGLLMENYNNYDKLDILSPSEQTAYFDKRLRNIEKLLALMLHTQLHDLQLKEWLTVEDVQKYDAQLEKIILQDEEE